VSKLGALAALAFDNVAAHALGYAAACAGLLLTLAVWIAALAVAEGVEQQALRQAEAGADLWIGARALGRHAPLDPALAASVRALDGVERVEARIVGSAQAGETAILVVGVAEQQLRSAVALTPGALPLRPGQALIGAELARELGLKVGGRLALDASLLQVFEISGVLDGEDALASAKALVVRIEDAQLLFADERISDLCVWTRPGFAEPVARAAARLRPDVLAVTRAETVAAIERAKLKRSGALSALLAPLLALATAAFAAQSWFVHSRRSLEFANYKLAGFSGGDLLVLTAIENALVAAFLATSALLLAWLWVRILGAPLLAPYLIADLAAFPAQAVPARFTPLPLMLGVALSFAATAGGSILAAWRLSLSSARQAFA
jgi:hypothetical protein